MFTILGHSPEHGFDEPLGLLSDCHRRIERFIAVLVRLVREFRGRALTPEAEAAVRTAQRYFAHAAPKHLADEEESLFPRMKAAAGARGETFGTVHRLESDHEEADALHTSADALIEQWLSTGILRVPQSRKLLVLLERLEALYLAHIRIEDHEVFPLAAELLSDEDLAAVGREMQARRGITVSVR